MIEAIGTSRVIDAGWWDTLVDGTAPAAMPRAFGGLLVVVGLAVEPRPSRPARDGAPGIAIDDERWNPVIGHAFTINGAVFGVVSFSFDGHTVTEGPRLAQAALDIAHVTAAGIWFGGVVALALLALKGSGGVRAMLARFAAISVLALGAVAVAGAGMALLIVDGLGDLTGTPWGCRYLLKLGLVAVAALIGAHHHYRVVPRLGSALEATAWAAASSVRRTLVVEAVVLMAVIAVTVMLVRSSTN